MSNIYHTEPITSGKVVLHTTYGDIDMELWSKEAPLACRNFIQLSLEGYYDNTIVHRVIKNFMVQMGDPTGSGTGGESIWGKPFKDEVHGRIKFNHRGQVAMANCGRPNSNQSQFFITLDACDGLHGKHTIFGKVTGNTFYNVIRMGEVETGEADRPVNEIRITSVEVLVNPFDDIVTRLVVRDVKNVPQEEKKGKEITAVAVKNNKLLSFGDDDEEEESSNLFKMKSALDSKKRKRSDHQPSFMDNNSSVTMKEPAVAAVDLSTSSNRHDTELAAKNSSIGEQPHQKRKVGTGDSDNEDEVLMDEQSIMLAMKRVKRGEGLRAHGSEFMQLRNELLQSRRAVNVLTGSEATAAQKKTAFEEMLTPLEQRRQKYMQNKGIRGGREEETLDKLGEFKKKLQESKSLSTTVPKTESYHGQVLEANSDNEESMDDWCAGKLKFKKHIDDQHRQGGKGLRVEEYEAIDPMLQRSRTHQ